MHDKEWNDNANRLATQENCKTLSPINTIGCEIQYKGNVTTSILHNHAWGEKDEALSRVVEVSLSRCGSVSVTVLVCIIWVFMFSLWSTRVLISITADVIDGVRQGRDTGLQGQKAG